MTPGCFQTYVHNKYFSYHVNVTHPHIHLRIIKHKQAATRVAFEVGFGKEEHSCFQTLYVPDVICSVHLER